MEKIILSSFLFTGLVCLIVLYKKEIKRDCSVASKGQLIIYYPVFGFFAGIACATVSVCVMLGFTIFSNKLPHIVFYFIFFFFLLLGLYLAFKIKNFKVIVDNKKIIVYSITNRSYSFYFQQISSVVRETKKTGAERIVIKSGKKRMIVENSAVGYKHFVDLIKAEVDCNKLIGF